MDNGRTAPAWVATARMGIALLASPGILAWTAFREQLDATQADLEPA